MLQARAHTALGRLLLSLAAATSLGLAGCTSFENLDAVELRPARDVGAVDADTDVVLDGGLDVGTDTRSPAPDLDGGSDADPDTGDGGDGSPCGPSVDWTSEADFGEFSPLGACDPVEPKNECSGDPTSRCGLNFSTAGGVGHFVLACKAPSSFGDQASGDACDAAADGADCQLGLHCVNWSAVDDRDPRFLTCVDLCEMDDDRGCPDDSFCTHHYPELPGLGICVASCDPYDANACPSGQVCAPDFDYPEKSRLPRFRCRRDVYDPQAPPAAHGRSCVLGHHEARYRYCGGRDICYPLTPGEADEQASCVRPCQSDTDCGSLGTGYHCPECGEGPWELRFCQPNSQ